MPAEPAAAFPIARTCPYAPHKEHVRLQQEAPVTRVTLPSGSDAWVIARHSDIRRVLADARFSSNRGRPEFPRVGVQDGELAAQPEAALPKVMLAMDAPEHGVARRAVLGEFTHRRMAELKPRIQEIVDEQIDAMLAGPRPVDLVRALALPVPSLVICELLGVPFEDHDFFQTRSALVVKQGEGPEATENAQSAMQELTGYLDSLLKAKEKNLTDDLLSRQILQQREANGSVDRADLVGLSFLLLVAGHETTANMIALGALQLSQDANARTAILHDPDKAAPAVEELLRYFTIAEHVLARVATEDVELGDQIIRAGDGVLALSNVANRDPQVFTDPDAFDIERGARNHLAFGHGPHQCLGQNLARLELQVVFDTLLRRIPDLRSAVPVEQLSFKADTLAYGIHELPVTW
ncbi:cytochrome P450 [Promicromonospora sukumoe]|uniref:Cytochrome P450 n=1 Tax=Promicromonospora sukumoe TaxID=88382 RepID=A0A7W3J7R4_9MICO|nr:cytochrome P450 [Promicromonospora sukumoe]MBA8807714.1 cytochrome P450 [Promicromonospora sukumoe]